MKTTIIKIILTASVVMAGLTSYASAKVQSSDKVQVRPEESGVVKRGTQPSWFLHDFRLAEGVHFPISASNYVLNWGTAAGFSPQMNYLWFGQYTGRTKVKQFLFPLRGLYGNLIQKGAPRPKPIYVFESIYEKGKPMGQLESAFEFYLTNGDFVGFHKNQVILSSASSGMEYTSIYSVKGIVIPKIYS